MVSVRMMSDQALINACVLPIIYINEMSSCEYILFCSTFDSKTPVVSTLQRETGIYWGYLKAFMHVIFSLSTSREIT